ncbi:unnamed protein product [Schistocephalus solidus]|uniref:C2H2-type domain-containing protein n=1 Tax=Schistocephalus solidus TaxID=70667 RepID=A0A183TCF4_SCHSO|nr:unnamed protein product [Schistocephalus solidus]
MATTTTLPTKISGASSNTVIILIITTTSVNPIPSCLQYDRIFNSRISVARHLRLHGFGASNSGLTRSNAPLQTSKVEDHSPSHSTTYHLTKTTAHMNTSRKILTRRVVRDLGRMYSPTEELPCEDLKHQGGTQHQNLRDTSMHSPVSRQSQEDRRWERAQVAGAAGAAPGRATTPGSDPTEWECHKGYIKKEPLQPDSQSTSQPLHTKHTLG